MPYETLKFGSSLGVPHPGSPVTARRDDEATVRAKRRRRDRVAVPELENQPRLRYALLCLHGGHRCEAPYAEQEVATVVEATHWV